MEEECGVFAIYNNIDAAINTTLGLHALQHRGQESCGIVSSDEKEFYIHLAKGLVSDNFSNQSIVDKLIGNKAIGHVRYSTAGKKNTRNHQPIFANFSFGDLAIAHNGNLTNAKTLKKDLVKKRRHLPIINGYRGHYPPNCIEQKRNHQRKNNRRSKPS